MLPIYSIKMVVIHQLYIQTDDRTLLGLVLQYVRRAVKSTYTGNYFVYSF